MKLSPKLNIDTLGWVVAATIGLGIVGSGYTPATDSYASVDMASLIDNSNPGKTAQTDLNIAKQARLDLLQFMYQNRVMSGDQSQQLTKLWLEANPPAADQSTLTGLKTQIMAATKGYQDLQAKTTLTAQDQTTLANDKSMITATQASISQMAQQFNEDMQQMQQTSASALLIKVKTAVQAIGKAQGYTIVFGKNSAPYCDHDLTSAVMDSLNKGG